MFLRSNCEDVEFPSQVTACPADEEDMKELKSMFPNIAFYSVTI